MNKFRAILINDALTISEVDGKGDIVRHVATIPATAVPQFLDDIERAKNEFRVNLVKGK